MRKLSEAIRWLFRVIASAGYKFYWDDCFSRASSLAYTTLFALVPVAALTYSMFGAFGVEQQQIGPALEKLLSQILPPNENELLLNLKTQVMEYLQLFGQTVRDLGAVSIGVLIFTGVALMNTIESALNAVWKVTSDKSILSKIMSFWTSITAGPLAMIFSILWYTKVTALRHEYIAWSENAFSLIDFCVPFAVTLLVLAILFYTLPSAKVTVADALLGALFSSVLFEVTKRGFATYISLSTNYSKFYGVLTTIPLFLFWLYLTWVVVLFGAEITYQAGSINILKGLKKYASELGEIGAILGLRILCVIGEKFNIGDRPPTESEIAIEIGSDPVLVRTCLQVLTEAELITTAEPKTHVRSLLKSPDKITIGDVFTAFHSKRYIASRRDKKQVTEQSSELKFLEAIRRLSKQGNGRRDLGDWTLGEIIEKK